MPYIILVVAGLLAIIDQIIKILVVNNLKPINSVEVIPNLFSLVYVENKGAAFGILENARWIFIVATIITILFLIYLTFKKTTQNKLFLIAVTLLIGGGIGNLIDRIFLGYVVDYLSLSFFPPVCNFADYCITAGVVLLIIYFLFYYDKDKKVKENG